ncbi:hypothetical protein Tco_1086260, partial [Tanacetum coccineum]
GLGGGGYLRDYVRIVAGTNDGESDSDLLIPTSWSDESKNEKRAKRWREEFEWKRSLTLHMPSEAVEQGMDAIMPDEIDGAKDVANPGVNELVDKGRPLKRKRVYAE